MSFEIVSLSALEILDSRSRQTLSVTLERAGGAGVTSAVDNANGEIAEHLVGRSLDSLAEADEAMQRLDGTPNKARLGANAIVGVSMALARALAAADGQPLHAWLPGFGQPARMCVPCFNVLNGCAHAANALDFQEFMVCPLGAPSMAEAVRSGAEVYAALRQRLAAGGHATGLGDEGGFAPNLAEPEDVLAMIVAAIEDAGYTPGSTGVAIALDPAASELRQDDGSYRVGGQSLSSSDLIERYHRRSHLGRDRQRCADQAQPDRHRQRNARGDGRVAPRRVRPDGLPPVRGDSRHLHRGPGRGHRVRQIKTGAPARGERVAKHNRLIEIAASRPDLPFGRL